MARGAHFTCRKSTMLKRLTEHPLSPNQGIFKRLLRHHEVGEHV